MNVQGNSPPRTHHTQHTQTYNEWRVRNEVDSPRIYVCVYISRVFRRGVDVYSWFNRGVRGSTGREREIVSLDRNEAECGSGAGIRSFLS